MKPETVETGQKVLMAKRIALRPLRRSDAVLITQYAGDNRVANMTTSIPHPLPEAASEEFISRVTDPKSDETAWVIDGSASGLAPFLGLISLTRIAPGQSEVGYWIAPPSWGEGFVSEALLALIAHNPLGDSSFVARVFQDNWPSTRVVEKAGFVRIGASEAFSIARDGMVNTWDFVLRLPSQTA